jgi:hypothetical protein
MKRLIVVASLTLLATPLSATIIVATGTSAYARAGCTVPPPSAYTKKGQCLKNHGAVWVPNPRKPGSCHFWSRDAAVMKRCGL